MAALLEQLHLWVQQVVGLLGYPGIFAFMVVENIFPPLPSELVVPFSGFMVAEGRLKFSGVLIASTLGSLVGTGLIYALARRVEVQPIRRWIRRYGRYLLLREDDLDRVLSLFARHGHLTIFLGRLLPGVRSLISIPAGLNCMPWPVFLIYTTAGTLLWNVLLAGAGVLLGRHWQRVLEWIDTYELILWVLFGTALATLIYRRLLRRKPAVQPQG